MKNSIRVWLITPLIALFVVPLVVVGAILSWQNYDAGKEQIKSLQMKLTHLAADNLTSFLANQQLRIVSMLATNYLPEMSRPEQQDLLRRFLRSVKDERHGAVFSSISLLSPQGQEQLRISRTRLVQPQDLLDMADSKEFTAPATTGKPYSSPVYFDKVTGEPMIKISVPINNLEDLRLENVLVTEMTLKFMGHLIDTMHIGKKGTAFITDQQGQLVAHRNHSLVLKKVRFTPPQTPRIMRGISGKKSVVAAEAILFGNQKLFFITETPLTEALQQINRSVLTLGSFLLFLLLGAAALGVIVVRQIIRPIESMAEAARKISQGNFSHQAEPARSDEIGDLVLAFNGMTERLLTTIGHLEDEKDFVRNVIESLTHPFYVIDANDYTIKLANSAAQFGDLKPSDTCHQLTHDSDQPCQGDDHPCIIREIKKSREPMVVEHLHKQPDGRMTTLEIYGYPIFDDKGEVAQIIEYNLDITDKKNLEAQLRQSQKLEAIGSLTGGVAHDFNNYLTTIIGYSQLAMMRVPEEDALHSRLQSIFDAGQKASALTRQLLAFSRKQVMEIKKIDLNDLIRNMVKMLGRLVGEKIEKHERLRDTIGTIKADPSQVEQIIMNLAVNARDAMPDGGALFFETDSVVLDEGYCQNHQGVSPGPYVVLSITDTGYGIPDEIKEKIFDPFFTTKKRGKGTGLGLSTVYGIVKQLNGQIFVYSEQGKGTTFKIYFPESQETADWLEEQKRPAILEGSETILVVDDESTVRIVVNDILDSLGYEVLVAASGEEALEVAHQSRKKISLLLTDVIMPGINGPELATKLTAMDPKLKVLFMSGYTENIITHNGVLEPGVKLINKPLVPNTLAQKIREILDSSPANNQKE